MGNVLIDNYLEAFPGEAAKLGRKNAPAQSERRPGEVRLDYPDRPEITNVPASHDMAMLRRGEGKLERPEGEPAIEYSNRPELDVNFVQTMRERNGRTLAQLRADYLAECAAFKARRLAVRPAWMPQLASDFPAEIKRVGPAAGDIPEFDWSDA